LTKLAALVHIARQVPPLRYATFGENLPRSCTER